MILLVAISGFCGLSQDSSRVILTYSVFLLLIFLGEIGAGILAYLYKQVVIDHLGQSLTNVFLQKYGVHNLTTGAIDDLQMG